MAFGVAAATLVFVLVGSALVVATVSERRLDDLRVQGPHVKRVGGVLLIIIGLWFIYLTAANPAYLLALLA